jgi:hypothetical protein
MPDDKEREEAREKTRRLEEIQRRLDEVWRRLDNDPEYRRTHIGRLVRKQK